MSPVEVPLGIALVVLGFGSIAGFMAFAAVRVLVEKWRGR